MMRAVWRTYLVDDLDDTLAVMERLLGWRPERPIERGRDGARRAFLGFRLANSPRLQLLQPADGSEEAEARARWGEGPWSMTIGVHDLDTKVEDLERRGTPYEWVDPAFSSPTRIVRVDRAADIGDAVRKAIAANKPYLIDVDIAADVNPAGAGVWELPGLGQSKAGIGTRYQPV